MSSVIDKKDVDRITLKLRPQELFGRSMRKFFKTATLSIANKVRRRTPSDLGDLRRSIETAVDASPLPLWGKVFTARVPLAFYVEYGTGIFAEGPGPKKGVPFFPPPTALDPWAQRHGIAGGGYAVAQAIFRRGGTPPVYFMQGGFEDAEADVHRKLQLAAQEIGDFWNSKVGGLGVEGG